MCTYPTHHDHVHDQAKIMYIYIYVQARSLARGMLLRAAPPIMRETLKLRLATKSIVFAGLNSFLGLGEMTPINHTLKGSGDINYASYYRNTENKQTTAIRGLVAAATTYFKNTARIRVMLINPAKCITGRASINGRIWKIGTTCEYLWYPQCSLLFNRIL